MSDDVVVEFRGQAYSLPVLLVGSVRSKLSHGDLCDKLEEAMDGGRDPVVLDGPKAQAFYGAARGISVSFDRGNIEWQRLLVDLQTYAPEAGSSRSRILAELPKRR